MSEIDKKTVIELLQGVRNQIKSAYAEIDKLSKSAFDIAIQVLEKQVPKTVTHEATLIKCCTCPTCKNVIDKFEQFGEAKVRVTYNYCHFCGQKLDWSEPNE